MKLHLWHHDHHAHSGSVRIACALIAIFVSLLGVGFILHGLVFDDTGASIRGAALLIGGVSAFVVALNLASDGES
ncbi:DUF2964 family protein [Paraburkholderia phosphatilytica]|uniref:DUF2964 family protein n=1 Tax=Paraburkholderia phosphatilytica TaxID=2282883 RepID=UPI001F0B9D4F|nr:DUF2964 family protein [Paraburkholderia phosphatilytica]